MINKINIRINKIDIDIDIVNVGFNEMYNVKPWKSEELCFSEKLFSQNRVCLLLLSVIDSSE